MSAPRALTDRDDPPASTSSFEEQARFRGACHEHLDFVWRFSAACGVEAAGLERVVQQVFSVVRGRLGSLEEPSELRVSIAGITRQAVRHYLRQPSSPLETAARVELRSPSDLDQLESLETKTAAELVDIILCAMSEAEREVFVLIELEGFTLSETAEALHVSEGTLRTRLEDARKVFNDVSAHLRAQRFWVSRRARGEW